MGAYICIGFSLHRVQKLTKLSDFLFKNTYIYGRTVRKSKEINDMIFRLAVASERQEMVGLRKNSRHRKIQRYCSNSQAG